VCLRYFCYARSLPALLRTLPEEVIGAKLADVLLSRMVVLNAAARRHLLPLLLVPRSVEPAPAAAVATSSPADSLSDAIVDPAEKLRTDVSLLYLPINNHQTDFQDQDYSHLQGLSSL